MSIEIESETSVGDRLNQWAVESGWLSRLEEKIRQFILDAHEELEEEDAYRLACDDDEDAAQPKVYLTVSDVLRQPSGSTDYVCGRWQPTTNKEELDQLIINALFAAARECGLDADEGSVDEDIAAYYVGSDWYFDFETIEEVRESSTPA